MAHFKAEFVFLTNDSPGVAWPNDIINDMVAGLPDELLNRCVSAVAAVAHAPPSPAVCRALQSIKACCCCCCATPQLDSQQTGATSFPAHWTCLHDLPPYPMPTCPLPPGLLTFLCRHAGSVYPFLQDPHRVPQWFQKFMLQYQSQAGVYVVEDRYQGE